MMKALSKFRVALAGAAVVLVVGLATPTILGAVTVAIWSHSGVFDAERCGPPRAVRSRRRGLVRLGPHRCRPLCRRGFRDTPPRLSSQAEQRAGSAGRVGSRSGPDGSPDIGHGRRTGRGDSAGGARVSISAPAPVPVAAPAPASSVSTAALGRDERREPAGIRGDLHRAERGLPLDHCPPLLRRRRSMDRDLGGQCRSDDGRRRAL